MDVDRIIGSTGIRVATLTISLLLVTAVVLREHMDPSGARHAVFLLVIGAGVLAFVGLIHSFRALYSQWLRFAGFLNRLVVALIFGGCYLLIVPWFFLMARAISLLRSRSRFEPESFWIPRRRVDCDARSLARMG